MIPRAFINEVLSRTDIVELIDSRVTLRKTGSNYQALCPFHKEKSPSFSVSPSKQIYHCFGCGANGNALSFIMEFDKLDFVAAVEYLAAQLGLEVPHEAGVKKPEISQRHLNLYDLLAQAAQFYQQQLRLSAAAKNYLQQRGLTGEICKTFQIGYAPAGWNHLLNFFGSSPDLIAHLSQAGLITAKEDGSGYFDKFRDRIMFPIRNRRGRMVGFGGRVLAVATAGPKYLNSPETPIFHKGSELYGLYEAIRAERQLKQIVVVEGYMDVLALAQQGITYAVATLGTATTEQHLKQLFRLCPEIIFCFDGDPAGKQAAWRALETSLPLLEDGLQVRFIFLPDGEDPDTLIRSQGKSGFMDFLTQAVPLPDFLFKQLASQVDLSALDGRARFASLVAPLLKQLPPGILQRMMVERLAQIVRLDSHSLENLTGIQLNPHELKPQKPHRPPKHSVPHSPMRIAIALLLQNPSLASEIKDPASLCQYQLPGISLLLAILELLWQQPSLTTAAILEYWRDKPEFAQLSKLANWPIAVPEMDISAEFKGAIARIMRSQQEYQIEQLLTKAQHQGLSAEEKQMLQALITQTNS